jgi:hypothetical protein
VGGASRPQSLAVQRLGQLDGQRPFSDAGRAADQVGVSDPTLSNRATQQVYGPLVADDAPGVVRNHGRYMPVSGGG